MGDSAEKSGGYGVILVAVAIPAIIGALVLGLSSFSGNSSLPNAQGRTAQQPASPVDERIAKTISILKSRIDTCAAVKENQPAIEETMANLNKLPVDLTSKKGEDGKALLDQDQITQVQKIVADAISDLNTLITLASQCGQAGIDQKVAATWKTFQGRFESLTNGDLLGIPLSETVEVVDQAFSDDNATQSAIAGKTERIFQWDYASVPYPSSERPGASVKDRGCAVIAMSMAVRAYGMGGDAKSVVIDLAQFSVSKGFSVPGGTSNAFFYAAAKKYNLKAKTLFATEKPGANSDAEWQKLIDALKSGQVVAASGRGDQPFTKGGHFILLTGLDSSGNILLNDSRRKQEKAAFTQAELRSAMRTAIAIIK